MNAKTTMKSLLAAGAFGAVIPATFAASSIAIDSVTQRWPWNNKVDITYTVTDGQSREAGVYAGVDFTIAIPGVGTQVVHGYEIGASAETGGEGSKRHTATWTAPAGVKATDCTVTATLFPTNVPSGNDYMVIDLSDGKVIYEGLMATQADSNTRYNTSEYKTAKMVLRKVPKWADAATLPNYESTLAAIGGYPTGHSDFATGGIPRNSPTVRQPDKDYYLSIFNLTMAQFRTLTGDTSVGADDQTYYRSQGYLKVRTGDSMFDTSAANHDVAVALATSKIVAKADGTFYQRLNYLTGLYFDYPTEVMHEIAARAGVQTKYIWGADSTDTTDIQNYASTTYKDGGRVVGSFPANNWGFYDMTGLGYDYCLGIVRYNVPQSRGDLKNQGVFDATIDTRDTLDSFTAKGGPSRATTNVDTIMNDARASSRSALGEGADWTGYRVAYIVE